MKNSKGKQNRKSLEDIRKKINLRKRQIAFDKYPKVFQDYLTKRGLNPHLNDVEDRIEYKTTVITKSEQDNIDETKL